MTTSEFAAFLAVSAPPNNPSIAGMATPAVIAESSRSKAAKQYPAESLVPIATLSRPTATRRRLEPQVLQCCIAETALVQSRQLAVAGTLLDSVAPQCSSVKKGRSGLSGAGASELNRGGEIALTVLMDELEVLAIHMASILESVADAVAAGVKRRILVDRRDSDCDLLRCSGTGRGYAGSKCNHGFHQACGTGLQAKMQNHR